MGSPHADPICVRNTHLHHILLGKRHLFEGDEERSQINKDGLIDALMVLHDECSADFIRNRDLHVSRFVDRYQPVIAKLKKLRVNVGDFDRVKVIGRGHFGEVILVKEKQTGDVYAMKVMKKSATLARQNIAFYEEEKDIMAKASSEWLTSLHCSFQDAENLYLVMEFHPGGDLLSLLARRDGTLSEDEARFYLAELIVALQSLHTLGYVHRDIKPENILLDRLGHVKLADFGSSARLDHTGTVRHEMPVGTADYIAPEVLTSLNNVGLEAGGYGRECDYWSLGILAYEMVYGCTPFADEKVTGTYGNIMNHANCLKFPDSKAISPEFRQLICGLLCDASKRLSYPQLVRHAFFASINWNSLRETAPPYVPVITSLDDTSNFDQFDEEDQPGVVATTTILAAGRQEFSGKNLPFIGFTFVKDRSGAAPSSSSTALTGSSAANERHNQHLEHLEEQLKAKTKEIGELRKKLLELEQTQQEQQKKHWSADLLQQQVHRLEVERDGLEKRLSRTVREADQLRRALELEKTERQLTEAKTLEMIKDIKSKWEKCTEKEKAELANEIQVWKDANAGLKHELNETSELLQSSMKAVDSLEKECNMWKAKSAKYKEMAARGHRMVEKRSSILPSNDSLLLVQTQQQLEKEKKSRSELADRVADLESRLRKSEAQFQDRLAEEETRWKVQTAGRESELRQQINQLQENVLRQKELRIRDLEDRLEEQSAECNKLKKQAAALQVKLDDSLQWKSRFESSFTARETELEQRIAQLEDELRRTSESKLELQQQVAQSSFREAENLQKYEQLFAQMQQSVDKLEKRNRQLAESQASSNTAPTPARQSDELQQKVNLLEAQMAKVEQQLEKSRENLTLEREKTKQLQTDLWKKEKELSDAKIDLRIANRELKSVQVLVDQLRQGEKTAQEKLKAKEDEAAALSQQVDELKQQMEASQRRLESSQTRLEDAEQNRRMVADLRVEVQRLKDEVTLTQRQKSSLESELERAEERMSRCLEDKSRLESKVNEANQKVAEKDDHFKVLQETCAVMDEQIRAFESMIESSEKNQRDLEQQKSQLVTEVERLKQDVRSAKQQANEEKSLKLFTESKLRDVESRLKSLETDDQSRIDALKAQNAEYSSVIQRINQQVEDLEQQLADTELSLNSAARRVAVLDEENGRLKEECAALRTQLLSVKNSNAVLSDGLEEALVKAETFKTRIVQLESQMESFKVMRDERELKLESTIGQQTKLIDFLQAKAELATKKKPTLSDKLFGSHKKENPPAAIPVAYRDLESMLEKKKAQVRSLMQQLDKCKAELAVASTRTGGGDPVAKSGEVLAEIPSNVMATPLAYRALSRLTQSPGTQESPSGSGRTGTTTQLAGQRMHHKIPHRLTNQLVMRATNCAVCLDSIHFGRQVSVCQECRATTHVKCAPHLPNTCGLPVGLAEHFGTVIGQKESTSSGRSQEDLSSCPDASLSSMEGWVKVPRPGKACWDRKFMKLSGGKLCLYDHEPSDDRLEPIDVLDLRPTDGTTVAIHSAVAHSEIWHTAKCDLPYIFMVELIPRTTCWPGRTLFVMAPNFPDKKSWVGALESVARDQESSLGDRSSPTHQPTAQYEPVLSLEQDVDVNAIVSVTPGYLLIGAEEGLFTCPIGRSSKSSRPELVRIDGVTNVQQMVVVSKLGAVLMIVGLERQLVMTDLRVLQGCTQALQVSKPSIEVEPIANADECHLFCVSDLQKQDDIFLCAATQNRVKLFKWSSQGAATGGQFVLRKELIVSETCSCIHFTEHSVLVGCDRFYEVDLRNYSAEEFLDASDSSLAYAVFGLKQIHSFPVAILEVTARRGEAEFLLCYHEFGIFVDGYGRRSRPEDVKWTRLPLAFAYRAPFLFVLHFNSVEVMRLTPTSFTAKKAADETTSTASSHDSYHLPLSVFVDLANPRYLGADAATSTSVYFFSHGQEASKLVRLDGSAVLGHELRPDEISLSGSEFSITSSVAHVLDGSDDGSSGGHSPLKRTSSNQQVAANTKRVKFESDL